MTGSSTSRYLGLNPNTEYDVGAHEVGHVLQNAHMDNLINNLDANGNACNGSKLCQDTRTLMVSALYYNSTSRGSGTIDYQRQPIELPNWTISTIFNPPRGFPSYLKYIKPLHNEWMKTQTK